VHCHQLRHTGQYLLHTNLTAVLNQLFCEL
jgi:hypothetical protein